MKIRAKVIMLFLVVGLLPVALVSLVAYGNMSAALLSSATSQLNSLAIKQEQRLTNLLQTKQEEVVKLANQYNLQLALRDYKTAPTTANKGKISDILQAKKIELTTAQSFVLTDLSGHVVASSAIGEEQPMTGTLQIPDVSNAAGVTIRKNPSDGFTKLYVSTTVMINKQKTAVLVAVFRTDDLIAVAQDYTGLAETGETLVVGQDQVSLFPLRFDTEAAVKTNLASLNLTTLRNGLYEEAKDYRGKEVFVVPHKMSSTNWIVATKIDKDEAFAPILALRNGLLVAVVAISAIIIAAAVLFTRLLTKPILQIGRVAEWIGHGDFMARLDVTRQDEIGALARSVNVMGSNLSTMVGNIESQRERLQIILDSITEGILAIDQDGQVILANSAIEKLVQMRPDTLVGTKITTIFAWHRGAQPFTPDYNVSDVHVYQNLQYKDKTGTERYAKVIISPVTDQKRRATTRAIVTIQDETSTHEFENMKTDFVSMAAHELRTPLTAVRGYLEVALYKNQHKDPDEVISFVQQALKNVDVLGGLINNLLDVTRIEKGTLQLNMEKVDLAREITQSIEAMRFAVADKKLTLTYTGDPSGYFVVADPLAIHEVITNLLSNAVKYTPEGGRITVSVTHEDNHYKVAVQDTGIGIPQTALPRLFHKFYRVHGGLNAGSTGTGLGLYIAKSILKRHHGTIHVQSAEGHGSTFTFSLPVFSEERLREMRPQDETEEGAVRRNRGWVTKNIAR